MKFVENIKKGDFVKISGEERYSTDEKGNEYLNVKAVYSKLLNAKQQEKSVENKKSLHWMLLPSFKDKISNDSKVENKKDKEIEL